MSTAAPSRRSRAARQAESDDLERRRALGQFFTPAEVANFMWDMVEILRKRRWHESDNVIDPACGDGAFLRVAIERGQKRNSCYGLDIDETLVPGWRKDAGVRGARVFLENGLENHPDHGIVPGAFDLVIGNPPFAGTGLKNLLRLLPLPGKPTKQAPSLFAEERHEALGANGAGGLGTISRAEREQLDRLVRRLGGYQCWRLCDKKGGDDASEAPSGRLFADADVSLKRSGRATDYDRMAKAILTTPPGQPLNGSLPEVRDAIRRMASTSIEVFFTERFVQLARPGGMIAVIVPESILASDQLGPLRKWFLNQVQLMAVVSLPHKVFTGVGANARTGTIFARRLTIAEERANAEAKEIAPGLRMTPELKKSQVIMVSPNVEHGEWSLQHYLEGALESVRAPQQRATKESRK